MSKSPGRDQPILNMDTNEMIQLKKELTHPSEERTYEKKHNAEKLLAHHVPLDKGGRISTIDRWDDPKPSMAGEKNL